ncbi:MAG TPA: hypothetical protein VFG59_09280 [Anaeromyxobacter sp.]|nr:hypothetical protein [Anaeromyxobacter sp.]
MDDVGTGDRSSLAAEHRALSERLASRASVDHARRGVLLLFLALVVAGLSCTLFWDRFGRPPSEAVRAHPLLSAANPFVVFALGAALSFFAGRALSRARRLARTEASQFARLLEVRRALEIDP